MLTINDKKLVEMLPEIAPHTQHEFFYCCCGNKIPLDMPGMFICFKCKRGWIFRPINMIFEECDPHQDIKDLIRPGDETDD